ncbi:iron-containing alcohol dehydrogenase [Aeromonas caviae]|uniref:iron-containing alcohol dehydrogenase n=1 Tax=Aeromonas caviae TaxID=648 RepID=UPI0029D4B6B8|nr:iron-containing alcohol dehydrogenase [Aeromonas caviae]MDX7717461.1 iron-containing alcohol dehydrogenase [Aeromonas caviae]MDX7861815.1 iron-containing alcohol dehydrogenase [Aeromonas caviae]
MAFALCLPQISLSGEGAVNELVRQMSLKPARRPLIVTEKALISIGLLDGLIAGLRDHGFTPVVFDGVLANPTDHVAMAALDAWNKGQCDTLIGFGGGSAIDTAKAVRALVANPDKTIYDFEGIGKVAKTGPFMACISTTSGTAAEVTSNAVITDTRRKVKMVIIDPALLPDIAVNDPAMMLGLPAAVTAATGMDALTHAIEAYVSISAHTLTDHSALAAISVIAKYLPQAVANGKDITAREMMAHGQFLAGMAFNSAGLGYVHSLAHQPGATHNLPHGVCNAILLPVVCEFNLEVKQARFADIASAMGVDTHAMNQAEAAHAAIKAIRDLSATVGIPAGLHELGIKQHDLAGWVDAAEADPCSGCAPRVASKAELLALYQAAF